VATIAYITFVAFFATTLSACTIMAMKQDVNKRQAVVAVKEDDLKTVEAERTRLHEQSIQLKNDLAAGQVSLDDLKSRLDQLQRVNANMAEATEEQRARKREGEVKLKNHQKAVIKVERSNATSEQKQKKLESMREEIVDTLDLLLKS
jgi:chromosome segregation ATPase